MIKKPTTKECLQMAIDGETYEFEIMYPNFKETAEFEGELVFANEANMQIAESKEHAEEFKELLTKAEKRFSALAKIEKRHAQAYQQKLEEM
jgi:rubrerythrin